MELTERLHAIEEEVSLMKVEIRTVLVDIRDELLKRSGPFAPSLDELTPYSTEPHRAPQVKPEAPVATQLPPSTAPPLPAPNLAAAPAAPAPEAAVQRRGPGPTVYTHDNLKGAAAAPAAGGDWSVLDIASLGKWAEGATRRIGRKRLGELLGVYELLTGQPEAAAKLAVLRMVDLCGVATEPDSVSMNEVLTVLGQLDALFRTNTITESTVFAILADAA